LGTLFQRDAESEFVNVQLFRHVSSVGAATFFSCGQPVTIAGAGVTETRDPSAKFWRETRTLYQATSTTEKFYYLSIKDLWTRLLESRRLPFEVRVETSEGSAASGTNLPDLALYDHGEFVSVLAEVNTPDFEIREGLAGAR
jgi:hypothetical protein